MKAVFLASALAAGMFLGTASGFPMFNKRALVTEVVYVTETVANVVVYVDESGQPYSTTTTVDVNTTPATTTDEPSATLSSSSPGLLQPYPAPSASAVAVPAVPSANAVAPGIPVASVEVQNNPPAPSISTAVPASPSYTSALPPPPPPALSSSSPVNSATAAAAPSAIASDDGGSLPLGVTYDPYTGTSPNAACKSAQQIAADMQQMSSYKAVRIYGSDCNQLPTVIQIAAKQGQKIMGGVFLSSSSNSQDLDTTIQAYKSAIDQYAGGNWDVIALFSVENERVNDHDMTASAVVDAIDRARNQLRSLGYNGPVGAVETVPAMTANPSICEASDVVMVNCHAFFDRNTAAQDAGTFVKNQIPQLKSACGGKRVVITESGWPHQGNVNGMAVPSPDNQRAAIDSLRANFNSDLFLFSSFDGLWKTNSAGTFNSEQFWGIM